jgi:hypothetical protein
MPSVVPTFSQRKDARQRRMGAKEKLRQVGSGVVPSMPIGADTTNKFARLRVRYTVSSCVGWDGRGSNAATCWSIAPNHLRIYMSALPISNLSTECWGRRSPSKVNVMFAQVNKRTVLQYHGPKFLHRSPSSLFRERYREHCEACGMPKSMALESKTIRVSQSMTKTAPATLA